jgi:hypothetical protein
MLNLKAYKSSIYCQPTDNVSEKECYLHKVCRIVFGDNARNNEYYHIDDKCKAIRLIDMVCANEEINIELFGNKSYFEFQEWYRLYKDFITKYHFIPKKEISDNNIEAQLELIYNCNTSRQWTHKTINEFGVISMYSDTIFKFNQNFEQKYYIENIWEAI